MTVCWASPLAGADDPWVVVQPPPNLSFWVIGLTSTRNPENLTLADLPSDGGVFLEWEAPFATDNHTLTGYTVYRVPRGNLFDAVASWEVEASRTNFTDTSALPESEAVYAYFVTAIYDAASIALTEHTESLPSNIVVRPALVPRDCEVVRILTRPPYVDVHVECL